VISSADGYGQKAAALKALQEIDRKKGDVKNIINEIAEIIDPKKLLWTVRLGKTLGKSRPTGQLAEFIGETNVQLIWRNGGPNPPLNTDAPPTDGTPVS
jgi:hypothetical protein